MAEKGDKYRRKRVRWGRGPGTGRKGGRDGEREGMGEGGRE